MNILEDLVISKVALCAVGMNQEAEILLFKSDEKPGEAPSDTEAPVADETIDKEALAAKVAVLEGQVQTLSDERDALSALSNEDLAALRGFEIAKAEEPEDDDVLKELPEAVRERLAKAEADAQKNADEIAKMRKEQRVESFVRKARDEFGDLAPAEILGVVLEEIDELAPEASKRLDQMLKSIAARAEASALFKEIGRSGSDADPGERLDAKVAELQKENPDLPRSEAISRVVRENPELMSK